MPKIKTSKEEVLKKVIPVLRLKGVNASSMSELAKSCGIQKSHFYYYFDNKEILIKEVLEVVHAYFQYNFYKIVDNDALSNQQKMDKIKHLLYKLFQGEDGGCIMANTALETAHLHPIYKKDIQQFQEVAECYHVAGMFDYLLKIYAKDMESYQHFLTTKLASLENISKVQSSFVLTEVKEFSFLPIE